MHKLYSWIAQRKHIIIIIFLKAPLYYMIWTIQGTTEIYRFLLSSVLSIFWTVQYCLTLLCQSLKLSKFLP